MTMTLSLCSRVIGSAHRHTERNIWVKFNENRIRIQEIWSRHEIQVKFKGKSLSLTLSLGSWVMCSAHRLTEGNI